MKKISLFQGFLIVLTLGLSPIVPILYAQELLPELAGPSAKHKAADEALDKQKTEAVAGATKPYLSALDGIEKTATAKGELEVVTAVVKERESAVAGSLDPELPAVLPKMKLQGTRKALLAKLEQLNADFAKRKKQSDADYLRFLATLQTKAASNPELAKQLATEKAALLAGSTENGNGGTTAKVQRGKNVVVNGDFENVVDGKLEGWNNSKLTAVTEGKNTFARVDSKLVNNNGTADVHYIMHAIDFPKDAKTVTISAKIRTKDRVGSKGYPAAMVKFDNQEGKQITVIVTAFSDKNTSWNTYQSTGTVPKEAAKAYIMIVNGRYPTQYDFDDIEVSFK